MSQWTLERLPAELQSFLNEHLPAILRREVREALAETIKGVSREENPWLRRKKFIEFHNISSTSLDRGVKYGRIEKDFLLGEGSPRYRLKLVKPSSEDDRRKAR